ncbi:MAG: type II secretion system protein GspN, partial [Myxococcota bacterium]
MRFRPKKILPFIGYPFFYIFCLAFFGYLTFPVSSLKGRLIAEFDKAQRKGLRPGEEPMRLDIRDLEHVGLTGLEITGATLTIPPGKKKPRPAAPAAAAFPAPPAAKPEEPAKASELFVDRIEASVRLWGLLTGDVVVDFEAEALGGTAEGSFPVRTDAPIDVTINAIELGKIEALRGMLQDVPVSGLLSGKLELTPVENKFSKATGNLKLTVANTKIGAPRKNEETGQMEDVVEIQGVSVPAIDVGVLALSAVADNGTLTFEQFGAKGPDFEFEGEGKIRLNEALARSTADMHVQFRFSDAYRTSSPAATSLLGKPGDEFPPLIEMGGNRPGMPNMKQAKTEEGFYRFKLTGPLNKLRPRAAARAAPKAPARRKPRSTARAKPSKKRKYSNRRKVPRPKAKSEPRPGSVRRPPFIKPTVAEEPEAEGEGEGEEETDEPVDEEEPAEDVPE